jgi:hypothetical protein
MTYICKHGTAHTKQEAEQAIAWAASKYPGQSLPNVGAVCWIKLWRNKSGP